MLLVHSVTVAAPLSRDAALLAAPSALPVLPDGTGVGFPILNSGDLVPDDNWVEVLRYRTTGCPGSNSSLIGMAPEGLSPGGYGDCGEKAYASWAPKYVNCGVKVPYGCWFNLVRGSGIWVNVGRSLRAFTRGEVYDTFGIPYKSILCDASFCDVPLNDGHPGDRLFCQNALERGYDSIQIARAHGSASPELVICSGDCRTRPLVGACPPLELRTGKSTRPTDETCQCDDRANTRVLNCAGAPESAPPTDEELYKDACDALPKQADAEAKQAQAVNAMAACPAGVTWDESLRNASITSRWVDVLKPGSATPKGVVVPASSWLPSGVPELMRAWDRACKGGLYATCTYYCVAQAARSRPARPGVE